MFPGGAEFGGLRIINLLIKYNYVVHSYYIKKSVHVLDESIDLKPLVKSLVEVRSSDVIISSISYTSLFCCLIKRRKQQHFVWLHNTRLPLRHVLIYRTIDWLFDLTFVADSVATQSFWRLRLNSRVEMLPIFYLENGVLSNNKVASDPRTFQGKIISVVRDTYQKGIDRIICLAQQTPALDFIIYGVDSTQLRCYGESPNNITCIKFAKPIDIYGADNIYLSLSRFEGLSISTIEAISNCMISICTNVGEIPEHLMFDKEFLVEQNSTEKALVDEARIKLLNAIQNYENNLSRFRNFEKNLHEKYSEFRVIKKIGKLLNENSNNF